MLDYFRKILITFLLALTFLGSYLHAQIGPEWKCKLPITIDNSFVDGNLANWTLVFDQSFSPVLTQDNGPLDADGECPSLNGGLDIRFSSDVDGLNELAVDIRDWTINNDPALATCEIAVKIPFVDKDAPTTIYMWWGNALATQAKPVDPFGQYNAYDGSFRAVWIDGGYTERTRNQLNGTKKAGIGAGNVTGKVGKATIFNAGNYFSVPNNGHLDFANGVGLTMSAIVKTPGGTGATQVILDGRDVANSWRGIGFTIGNNGFFGGYLRDENNTSTSWNSNAAAHDNNWRHLSVTYADNEIGKTYLNGILTKESVIAEISLKNNAPTLNIGLKNPPTSGWSYFLGSMDEFRISSTTRNAAWLKAEYHNQFNSPGFLSFGPILNCSNPAIINVDNITPNSGSGSNGSINISITSGLAPYQVELVETGATAIVNAEGGSFSFNGLEAGTYSILVNDSNPCESSITDLVILNKEDCEIGSNYLYRVPITIDNSFIDEDLSNWTLVFDQSFSPVLTQNNGPLDADGSAPSLNGGADIRFSSDEAGENVLARDIRNWQTNNNPAAALCEVAVKIPIVNSTATTTVYMWWGNPDAFEPQPSDDCGQYNAYDANNIYRSNIGGQIDRTSFGNNGTVVGPTVIDGRIGKALYFNGISDVVSIPSIGGDLGDFTISSLIRLDGIQTNNTQDRSYIADFRGYNGTNGRNSIGLFVDSDLEIKGFTHYGGISYSQWKITEPSSILNTWKLVTFVREGTTLRVYSNDIGGIGQLDAGIAPQSDHMSLENNPWSIGQFAGYSGVDPNFAFNGLIDEISISNVSRSSAWIKANYNNLFNTPGFLSFGAIDYCVSPVAINIDNVIPATGSGSNGSIDLTITNGTPPYDLELIETGATAIVNTNGGSYSFSGLEPGTYSISVSDNNSCTALETNLVVLNREDCQIGPEYSYKLPISIDNSFIDEDLVNWTLVFDQSFSAALTQINGPLDADGSAASLNGGADIRFSSDASGNNILARDIRRWETNNDPALGLCEVAVKVPVVNNASTTTIYMWWGNPTALEPLPTDDCGQYNAYDANHVGIWTLNEDPSGIAPQIIDRTSNQNNTSSSGAMTTADVVTGKLGNATDFDGTDDYFSASSSASLGITSAITVEASFAIDSWTGSNFPIISKRRTSGAGPSTSDLMNYLVSVDNTGKLAFAHRRPAAEGSGANVFKTDASVVIADGAWNHVGITYTFNTPLSKFVALNGVSEASSWVTNDGTGSAFANNEDLTIGRDYYSPITDVRLADGRIDELRLSNIARSAAWLKANYNNLFNTPGFLSFGDITSTVNPGGVTTDLQLWLRADEEAYVNGTTPASDGQAVETWHSQALLSTSAEQSDAFKKPIFKENGINNNPALHFNGSGDFLRTPNVMPGITDSFSGFVVLKKETTSDSRTIMSYQNADWGQLWSYGSIYGDYNFTIYSRTPATWNWNFKGTHPISTSAQILSSVWNTASNLTYFTNGAAKGTFAEANPTTSLGAGSRFIIGGRGIGGSEVDFQEYFDGLISEVIYFGRPLSLFEQEKVRSYLSIKYGITKQSVNNGLTPDDERDYFSSDGTIIWDQSANTGFDQMITGIGRDDASGLTQTKSRNIAEESGITLEKAGLFGNDQSFVICGSNNEFGSSTAAPAGYEVRSKRVWKVNVTGTPGAINATFHTTDFGFVQGNNTSEYALLIDSDGDFTSGATIYTAGASFVGNDLSFSNITLNDGDYLSIAKTGVAGPGQVTDGLRLWLKADAGVIGNPTTGWKDQSIYGFLAEASANAPTLVADQLNSNPTFKFDETAKTYFTIPGGIIKNSAPKDVWAYYVSKSNNINQNTIFSESLASSETFYSLNVWSNLNVYFQLGNVNTTAGGGRIQGVWGGQLGTYYLWTGGISSSGISPNSTYKTIYRDGEVILSNTNTTDVSIQGAGNPLYIGGRAAGNDDYYMDGNLAELIIYAEVPSALEQEKIHSYLSLKYGLTKRSADIGSTPEDESDYFASDGSVIWDHSANVGFDQIITGIGRDDGSRLNQIKSRNNSNSSGITLIKNGVFSIDKSFIVVGSNNEKELLGDGPVGYEAKSKRVWKANVTGTPGTINATFHIADIAFAPGSDPSEYALLIDSDGDFTSGATIHTDGASFVGNDLTFTNISISDGDYLAIAKSGLKAPGNVFDGLRLWLKADEGVTGTTNVSLWEDQSIFGNNASQSVVADQPSLVENRLNSKPSIDFSGSTAKMTFDSSPQNRNTTVFVIGQPKVNTTWRTMFRGNTGDHPLIIESGSNRLGYYDNGNGNFKYSGFNWNANEAAIVTLEMFNGSVVFRKNGTPGLTINSIDLNSRYLDNFGNFQGNNQSFGYINELIVYNGGVIPEIEKQKIETYLAIKYGFTKSNDYLNSDGDVIWDYSANASFAKMINGIGRDDVSGLNQIKSKSISAGSALTIEKPGGFSSNKDMLVVGSNGSTGAQSAGPASHPTNSKRKWRVQLTGTPGLVDLSFDLSAMTFKVSTVAADYVLLIDDDGDYTTGATLHTTGVNLVGDILTFTDVSLTNGQYFALAAVGISAPGNVYNGLKIWLKADKGLTGSAPVTQWFDQSPNGFVAARAAGGPDLLNNVINFNPSLEFETSDYILINGGILDNSYYSHAYVILVNKTNTVQNQTIFSEAMEGSNRMSSHLPWGDNNIYWDFGTYNVSGRVSTNWGTTAGKYHIWTLGSSTGIATPSGTRKSIYRDGTLIASNNNSFGGRGANNTFNLGASHEGDIAEFIVYTQVPSPLELEKIQSYLSIKYGITKLSSNNGTTAGEDERDYFASDDNVIWDYSANAGYNSLITGIGRDDASGLNQLKSKNIGAGSALTIEKPGGFSSNKDMLVVGSNGSTGAQSAGPAGHPTNSKRKWRVQLTGTPGLVDLSFDLSAMTFKVSTVAADYVLLIDDDGDYTTGATLHTTGVNLVGDILTFTDVSLTNGQYFALAAVGISAPGNVYNGLKLWLKADKGLVGSAPVTQWFDQSPNGFVAARAAGGPDLLNNEINFNPSLEFETSDALFISGGILGSSYYNKAFVILINKTNTVQNSNIFSEGMSGTNTRFGSHLPWSNNNIYWDFGPWDGAGRINTDWGTTTGKYHIWTLGSSTSTATPSGTRKSIYRDGKLIASNNNSFGGNGMNSTLGLANGHDGDIAEFIVYTQVPSPLELEKIQSYLSIKYGITKLSSNNGTTAGEDERDYFASDDNVIWDYSANAGYNSLITGIGRDDASGLNQLKSKNIGAGSALRVEKPVAFPNDNSYIVWGNNGASDLNANAPAGYSYISGKNWKVNVSGTPGLVDLTFNLSTLAIFNSGDASDYALLIDTDTDFTSGAFEHITGASISGNELTFQDVDLSNNNFLSIALVDDFSFENATFSLRKILSEYAGNAVKIRRSSDNATMDIGFTAGGDFDEAAALAFAGAGDAFVEVWYDQSGFGFNATQANVVKQPKIVSAGALIIENGRPSIRFDGVDDQLVFGNSNTNNFTFFLVAKPFASHEIDAQSNTGTLGTSGQKYLLGARWEDSNAGQGLSMGSNGISNYEHGSGYMPATGVYAGTTSGLRIIDIIYTNRRPTIYLDGIGVRTGVTSAKPTVISSNQIGSGSYGAFIGLLSEVRLYDRSLITSDRKAIECDIAHYYSKAIVNPGFDYYITAENDPYGCEGVEEKAVWELASLENIVVDGSNNLSKISGGNSWNGGAASSNRVYDNGYMEFSGSEQWKDKIIGLSTVNSGSTYSSVKYGIRFTSNKFLIVESGVSKTGQYSYSAGSKFRISIENGVVKYYYNYSLVYTSSAAPTLPMIVDMSIYNEGGTFKDVIIRNFISGTFHANVINADNPISYQWKVNGIADGTDSPDFTPLTLNNNDIITCEITIPVNCRIDVETFTTNFSKVIKPYYRPGVKVYLQSEHDEYGCEQSIEDVIWDPAALNFVYIDGNNDIQKRAGGNSWNGGAASLNMVYDNGYMEFAGSESWKDKIIGLSTVNSSSNYSSVKYGVRFTSNKFLIVESGVSKTGQYSYSAGSKFRISIENGVVKYYYNYSLVYTSVAVPTLPMVVDVSMYSEWSTFKDVVIRNLSSGKYDASVINGEAPINYQWTLNGTDVGDGTSTYINNSLNDNDEIRCEVDFPGSCRTIISAPVIINAPFYRPDQKVYLQSEHDEYACEQSIEDVIWDPTALNFVYIDGNNDIQKRAGGNSWNGGAASLNKVYDNGYMEFAGSESWKDKIIGLSTVNSSSNYSSVKYGVRFTSNKFLIVESGTDRTGQFSFVSGGKFRISVENGVVKYYYNSSLVYTSLIAPVLPMVVDVSMYSEWSTFKDVVISNLSSGRYDATVINGEEPIIYQWTLNGVDVGDGTSTYINSGLNNNDQIRCEVDFPGSCRTLVSAPVKINSPYSYPGKDVFIQSTADPLACKQIIEDVIWDQSSFYNIATYSDNRIQKLNSSGWDGGAASINKVYNGGYVELTANIENSYRMIGLSSGNTDASYTSIEYTFYLRGDNTFQVRENGAGLTALVDYTANDKFRIAVIDDTVKYFHNGSLVYTSLVLPGTPLLVDVSIHSVNGTFRNVKIANFGPGEFTAIPINTANPVSYQWTVNGANDGADANIYSNPLLNLNDEVKCLITLPGGCGNIESRAVKVIDPGKDVFIQSTPDPLACKQIIEDVIWDQSSFFKIATYSDNRIQKWNNNAWDGGAVSLNKVYNGGYMELTANIESTYRMIGLSSNSIDENWNTIEYTFYLRADNTYDIRESGSVIIPPANYNANDKFRIAIVNDTVKYFHNGSLVYTSLVLPSSPLLVDVSIYTLNGTFRNVKIANFGQSEFTAIPINSANPVSYQWTVNGANDGADANIYSNPLLNLNDEVKCLITLPGGCGNIESRAVKVIEMDSEPPVVTCPVPAASYDMDPGECHASLSFAAVASDNCGVASITYSILGADITFPYDFLAGTTTVTTTVEDTYGNTTTCDFDVTVVDNQDPGITCPLTAASYNMDAGECNATLSFAAAGSDNCAVDTIIYSISGSDIAFPYDFTIGTTTVTATVEDINGNTSSCDFDVVVVDNLLPAITCAADQTQAADAGSCDAFVTITGPVTTDNCGVATVVNDFTGTINASGIYPIGQTTVIWTVADIYGNIDSCSQIITVTDTQAPTITCPVPAASYDMDPGECNATLSFAAVGSDNCGVDTITYSISGTDITFPYDFTLGTSTVTATVEDVNGNTSSCAFDVVVVDNQSPDISCPSNINTFTSATSCDTLVSIAGMVYDDNCSIVSLSWALTGATTANSLPAGIDTLNEYRFNEGLTNITYTIKDNSNTSTCSFTIEVIDNVAPIAICKDTVIELDAGGNANILNSSIDFASYDNCGISTIVANKTSFGLADIGDNNVTLTVTDIHGNTETCVAVVTVNAALNLPPTSADINRNNICAGDGKIVLSYSGGLLAPGSTAEWYSDALFTVNVGSGNNLEISTPLISTNYYVRFEGPLNTTTAQSKLLNINPNPAPVIGGPDDVCLPGSGVFSVQDLVDHTYVWTISEGTISSGSGTHEIQVDYALSGMYNVDLTMTNNLTGCSGTAPTHNLTVHDQPTISEISSNNKLLRR
jgi:hypothetical protein